MASTPLLLALDQGTTSTRAILFDAAGAPLCTAQRELRQIYPEDGWVEHDPEEIWQASVAVLREAAAGEVPAAIGIANQRETALLWDRESGACLHNAIVWQDRRTAPECDRLRAEGAEAVVAEQSGLVIDPYFSATKLAWLLDELPGARGRRDLAFGTVDSFLAWRLTGGRVHATDATNASRTSLFDIRERAWSPDLLELFRVPEAVLPEVRGNADGFGVTDILGPPVPIAGMAGDQQAATLGQGCLEAGDIKSTYGTGCFLLAHTGEEPVASRHRLLTTVALELGGRTTYALEGAVFVAGAAVQWLRDGLGVIADAAETEALARNAGESGVVMVPAFVGLGAPWWDAEARGALFGLTRDTGPAELARAALEAAAHHTADLLDAAAADGLEPALLRIDGAMSANDWFAQRLADVAGLAVERPAVTETTAWGAAVLAGLGAGVFSDPREAARTPGRRFEPGGDPAPARARWADAVARTLSRPARSADGNPDHSRR
ncbi:MAG: glycerol kinase [Alphaproteobacteria bacterium]|nr:glycerol kinase [Alphaproteobacteria bacterium]